MTTELTVLALGAVLLLVHIMLAIRLKTQHYGVEWNMGARDEALPPLNPVAARLERARDNFAETFPVAIVALLRIFPVSFAPLGLVGVKAQAVMASEGAPASLPALGPR